MAEQTSLVAQQVRLMHWVEQIRECQNRLYIPFQVVTDLMSCHRLAHMDCPQIA